MSWNLIWPRFYDLRSLLLRQLSVMVHDVPADQFTEDGAGHDIGREMIQTADAREADGCCRNIPHDPVNLIIRCAVASKIHVMSLRTAFQVFQS